MSDHEDESTTLEIQEIHQEQDVEDIPEKITRPPPQIERKPYQKPKKVLSQAQLDALQKGRERRLEKKAQERTEKAQEKVVVKPKKPKKQKIIYEDDSESEEEVIVRRRTRRPTMKEFPEYHQPATYGYPPQHAYGYPPHLPPYQQPPAPAPAPAPAPPPAPEPKRNRIRKL